MLTIVSPKTSVLPEPQVLEIVIRVPGVATAQYLVDQIKDLLPSEVGAQLENYAIIPESVFDAPGAEVEGVPA